MFVQDKIAQDIRQEKTLVPLEDFLHWYRDGYEGRFKLHKD